MKNVVLCADDYSQNPAISKGILNLIEAKRLSATSCMTNTSYWDEHSQWLLPYKEQIDIGLHFNLTEGQALSQFGNGRLPSLPKLLLLSQFRLLNPTVIRNEFQLQLQRFVDAIGSPPDFIDGHQHVHHLPIIRDVILSTYQDLGYPNQPYFRVTSNGLGRIWQQRIARIKSFIIALTGANRFKKLLGKQALSHNQSFAGIYNFADSKHFAEYFKAFLKQSEHQGLIMCHPGLIDSENDPLQHSRPDEYSYLMSNEFLTDCETAQVRLARHF